MDSEYDDFLHRIIEERERLQLSQKALALELGLTQSHYSKNELGKNRFSFQNLHNMSDLNFDLYYAFSGKRLKLNIDRENRNEMQQRFFLQNIFIALSEYNTSSFNPQIMWKLDYIKYVSYFSYTTDKNIFKILLSHGGLTQMDLAERLGIDTKKFRRLERKEILPDSEIIFMTLKEFGITPLTLMEEKNAALYQADYVLRLLDEAQRTRVLAYLKRYTA